MKAGTDKLMKFRKLGRALGLRAWQVTGLLQSLWNFTELNAPRGDVGRWTDDELALGLDWDGDGAALVAALVATGWLDAAGDHRLVVHGWSEHCEARVHNVLARRGETFADGARPSFGRLSGQERTRIAARWEAEGAWGSADRNAVGNADRNAGGNADALPTALPEAVPTAVQPHRNGARREAEKPISNEIKALWDKIEDADALRTALPTAMQTLTDTDTETEEAEPKRTLDHREGARDGPSAVSVSACSASAGAASAGGVDAERDSPARRSGALGQSPGPRLGQSPVLLREGAGRAELNALWRRGWVASRDGDGWRNWWIAAFRALAVAEGGLSVFEEVVRYAEDCADPAVRRAKDLGPLKRPGAWMVKRLLAWARAHRVVLPALPERKAE